MANLDTESMLASIEREVGKAGTMVELIQGYGFEDTGSVLSRKQAEKIAAEKLYIANELLVIFDAMHTIRGYVDALNKRMDNM